MQIDSDDLFMLSDEIRRAVNHLDALPPEPSLSMLSDIASDMEGISDKLRSMAEKMLHFEIGRAKAEELAFKQQP